MRSGVYAIEHESGKLYIGSSIDMKRRMSVHRSMLRHGYHSNRHLQAAWNKHGEQTFIFRGLLICDKKDLIFFEQRAMDVYRSYDHSLGYNIRTIAESNFGCSKPGHTKKIKREPIFGYAKTILGERNRADFADPVKGPKRRAAISEALKGRSMSDSHREAIRLSQRCRLKMTDEQIISCRTDPRSARELSLVYGVSQAAISSIRAGKTWSEIV